ncbi:hypothetical protein E4T43_03529 [Aureobasidium subglaciale]|nr:hypothetical protein E4T43_03529 [Aureobasidium subglaciale]
MNLSRKSLRLHCAPTKLAFMSSPLERTILRLQASPEGLGLGHFLKSYLTPQDMLSLRLTSHALHDLYELNEVAFETIYIHTPVPPGRKQYTNLLSIAERCCRHVVVSIAFSHNACQALENNDVDTSILTHDSDSGSDSISDILETYCPYVEPPVAWKFIVQRKPGAIDQSLLQQWCDIFKLLPEMETLKIACNGDPAWPGCTDIEITLIMIRITLERINPKHIHTVCLSPIHAMGIMHLRWAGSGAYGEACASRDSIWYRLKVLKLDITSPYSDGLLSESQKRLFEEILVDYLHSFSRTLTRLDLAWTGVEGLNPFCARNNHRGMKLTRSWDRLEELRLANVSRNCGTLVNSQLAPDLKKVVISNDAPDTNARLAHDGWKSYLSEEDGVHDNHNASWMTLQDVRISAIPEALFQHRLS